MNGWLVALIVMSAVGACTVLVTLLRPWRYRPLRCGSVYRLKDDLAVRCIFVKGHHYLKHHWHPKTRGTATIEWDDEHPASVQVYECRDPLNLPEDLSADDLAA